MEQQVPYQELKALGNVPVGIEVLQSLYKDYRSPKWCAAGKRRSHFPRCRGSLSHADPPQNEGPSEVKHIPNIITTLRFLGAACLLFCNPAGTAFWVIYGLCGVSDMVDGYLARRLHAESKTGAVLDSVADICLVACCALRLLPVFQIPMWLWIWAGLIVLIKMINQVSAWVIRKRFCFPHTKANKLTGLLLFLFVPTVLWSLVPIAIVAGVATFAAIQEGRFIREAEGAATSPRGNEK